MTIFENIQEKNSITRGKTENSRYQQNLKMMLSSLIPFWNTRLSWSIFLFSTHIQQVVFIKNACDTILVLQVLDVKPDALCHYLSTNRNWFRDSMYSLKFGRAIWVGVMEPSLSFVLKVPGTKAFHCLWHTGNPCGYNGQKELCMTLPSSVTLTMFLGHPARFKILMYVSIVY